ncbi:hypothetical protein AMOR_24940 [Anaeromyxobacter oryzae]|uniref:Uncharacterized protein n=1 Tax=Anaeromyxobacter oryzae TaxID=2918170 RepID=A0ABM7WVM4_9BACT|nr:hypothetical protein AMOR_24940 [Anaeromyxobacter oryzae]
MTKIPFAPSLSKGPALALVVRQAHHEWQPR